MERLTNLTRTIGCLILAAGSLLAQTINLGLASAQDNQRSSLASSPIAGYAVGPGQVELHSLLAISGAIKMGGLVPAPVTSKRLYLPPRQQYALVERNSDGPIAVWALHKSATTGVPQDLIAIPDAMAHPDEVIFSPRGESLLLYSRTNGNLQVITQLPADSKVSRSLVLPIGPSANLAMKMAVSDDGAVVVAVESNGGLINWSSSTDMWSPVRTIVVAQAVTFISKTHDLAVSDTDQKAIVLLSNVEGQSSVDHRVIAHDMDADRLISTRSGEQLMAANLAQGTIWNIDVGGSTQPQKYEVGPLADLFSIRDGYTFLMSASDSSSVLKLKSFRTSVPVNR